MTVVTQLRTHTDVDRDVMIATLVVAFAADPIMRWVFPRSDSYLTHFPELAVLMGGPAFAAGTADAVDEDAGVALWVPPGEELDNDGLVALLERSIAAPRKPDAYAFLEQVQRHHPTQPHWYLPFMGVDPRRQGQGLGSTLLARALARCDDDRLPAYLEASSPRNRALYERHGFTVIAEIQAGDSPALWPMLRTAR